MAVDKLILTTSLIGSLLGGTVPTTVSTAGGPAHTPSDKFAINGVYQTIHIKTDKKSGEFRMSYGSGFFVEHRGRTVFVTAGHNCKDADQISLSRADDLFDTEIVYSGEPEVDICLLKASARLKPTSVYKLASKPFKANTELVSYGYAEAVRLVKLWHRVIEYTTIPQIHNRRFLAVQDPTYKGCSGGPIVNAATGNVAGIIVMTSDAYALATPTSEIAKAIDKLKEGQYR